MSNKLIKITDTTFRDGHQSLLATRLRTSDMEPIAEEMDSVGFHSLEVWGGATFDAATRYLAEDPWDRLRTFKRLMPKTPLMMLLRGQSLVGYRNYADDVVKAFVKRSAEAGIDIFRVFDALNDERNLEAAAHAVKSSQKHLQMVICYSVTEEGKLGGPIYNLDYYVSRAKTFQNLGADSLCIKDMAGLLAPYDAFELVTALKATLDVPLQLHTHYTSGMASMTVLKAIEAGLDIVDTCLAPLALRTAQPAVEPLIVSLQGSERDPGIDLDKLLEMGDYLETILSKYKQHMETPKASVIDARVLRHQIPGGMISNLVSQLREGGALDKLPEVLEEIPRTRKDLGYPPLVTPISQMVGSQSVSNVLLGRYQMISEPVKDYAFGLFGRPPVPMDSKLSEIALDGYGKGNVPITVRPGDLLEPEISRAKDSIKDISNDMDDVLTYALYPTTGLKFLKIKHGLEPIPEEMKDKSDEQSESKEENIPKDRVTDVPRHTPATTGHQKSDRIRTFNVYVSGEVYEVAVDPVGGNIKSSTDKEQPVVVLDNSETMDKIIDPDVIQQDDVKIETNDTAIKAPLPGLVLRYIVKVGQQITAGEPIVILEAMKMENSLSSPTNGTVTMLTADKGASVDKDQILAVISPSSAVQS